MAESEWKRTQITESGNYPKQSFMGVLTAIYPSYKEGLKGYVLKLDFEDGKTYDLPLNAKEYGLHEDGSIDGFLAIGQFLASIERLDAVTGQFDPNNTPETAPDNARIQTFWAFLDGRPAGFKTEPDIVGKTLHNVARPRQVGDAAQTSKYPDWTIGAIDGLTTQPAEKKGGYPPKPKPAKEQPPISDITGIVLDALTEPNSISELFTALGKKYKVSELRTTLESLKVQGVVVESNGKYQVV